MIGKDCMFKALPFEDLGEGGLNSPRYCISNLDEFEFSQTEGAAQYRYDYDGKPLDCLFLKEDSDTLIVSFHGALNRKRFSLPRYERLKSVSKFGTNSIYFSDPTLWLDDSLQLAWYTGWGEVDIQADIAELIVKAKTAAGASKVIVSGSSGGGFAALQVSALIPESVAVVFNPSVYVQGYLVDGKEGGHGTERKYLEVVRPEVLPVPAAQYQFDIDWASEVGDKVSALERYATPRENFVLFCQTPTDWHYGQHYLPFLAACAKGDNLARIRVHEYGERVGHFPPTPQEFDEAIVRALRWAEELHG